MVALTKLVGSQVKSKQFEQAEIALEKLEKGLRAIERKANADLLKAKNEYNEHPDSKYVSKTISAINKWKGFDQNLKDAKRKALLSKRKMEGFGEDFEAGVKFRDAAVIDCKAWDVEFARVAKAKERHDKVYEPLKTTIESAQPLALKQGLPKPVAVISREFVQQWLKWDNQFRIDAFDDAIPEIEPLGKVAQKLLDEEKRYREAKQRFDVANKPFEMAAKEARDFAELLTQRKLNVGATKTLCDNFTDARKKVDEKLKTFDYDNAIPLVPAVKTAADELLKFKTKYENDKQTASIGWNNLKADVETAFKMPSKHPKFGSDRQILVSAQDDFFKSWNQFDYSAAVASLDPLEKATAKLKSAYDQMQIEKDEFNKAWDPFVDDYSAVKNLGERDKKVKPLVEALKKAWDNLCIPYGNYDYVGAKKLIPPVVDAIKPLLTERPKQEAEWNKALKKVEKVRKKFFETPEVSDELKRLGAICSKIWYEAQKMAEEGDFLGAKGKLPGFIKAYDTFAKQVIAHDKLAEPEAKEARKEVEKLLKNDELKDKTVAEKKELLDKLRGATTMSKDNRKAMRQIYNTLDLDPDFLEEDKKRRNKVTDKMTDSPEKIEELKDFRKNWAKKDLNQKLSIVSKALLAQCEAMGFGDDPPEIITFEEAPKKKLITNGYFKPSDGNIYLNTHADAKLNSSLEETLDLIFHENSHNYQNKLVIKFNKGEIDEFDPEYKQAELFALNKGPHSYVKGEESFDDYQKQPLEEHAHENGPKTAKKVMKKLL